jgi:hypothetical protein
MRIEGLEIRSPADGSVPIEADGHCRQDERHHRLTPKRRQAIADCISEIEEQIMDLGLREKVVIVTGEARASGGPRHWPLLVRGRRLQWSGATSSRCGRQ